jgi:trans-aconitate methyltransferase
MNKINYYKENSDKNYWNNFYHNNNITKSNKASNFCNFVINYFKNFNIIKVIDCGCGNGRDTYELNKIYKVHGIDNNGFKPKNDINCNFYNEDFVNYNKENYDLIYSRFTFHSITNEQHFTFLNSIKVNSYIAIETRSDKNKDEHKFHGDNHYRNYTNIDYLKNLLENKFDILYIDEKKDFAIFENENPICIRVIAKKKLN